MDIIPLFDMEPDHEEDHHSLWAEKYRPKKLEDFLGSESVKETMRIFLEKNDIPHLMFYSSPGTGKTSLGKLLTKIIPCDSIIINASDENGVDDIRNKVQSFALTIGIHPLKVIFLDECLDENTLIWILRDGMEQRIPIKNLNDKIDLVRSYNIEKKRIEWRPFDLISQGLHKTYEIEFENGEIIICTDTHKWYVRDENENVIRVETSEMISGKYTYILTTEEN